MQAIYSQLKDLLAGGYWQEADQETRTILCQIAGQQDRLHHLTPTSIQMLPCQDLQVIDGLWSNASQGNFGFSIQSRLWLESGGSRFFYHYPQMTLQDKQMLGSMERRFALRVGWQLAAGWSGFSTSYASAFQQGHLPLLSLMCSYGLGLVGLNMAAIAERIESCNFPMAAPMADS